MGSLTMEQNTESSLRVYSEYTLKYFLRCSGWKKQKIGLVSYILKMSSPCVEALIVRYGFLWYKLQRLPNNFFWVVDTFKIKISNIIEYIRWFCLSFIESIIRVRIVDKKNFESTIKIINMSIHLITWYKFLI